MSTSTYPLRAPEQIPAADSYEPLPVAARLRELLGRRLLRAERWDDAGDYFARSELQQQAHDYAEAREQGQSRWSSQSARPKRCTAPAC